MSNSPEGAPGITAAECGSRASLPWYCINTHPGQAEQAIRHIRFQRFHVWYPQVKKVGRPRPGSNKPVPDRYLPLFPNYMFVSFDVERDFWHPLMNTHGVKHLFRLGGMPTRLSDADIMLIEVNEDVPPSSGAPPVPLVRAVLVRKPAMQDLAGQELVLVNHQFEGHKALCDWSDNARVALLLTILGKQVKFTVRRNQVQTPQ